MKLSKYLTCNWPAFFLCMFFITGSAVAANPNADPRCAGLSGAAFGLCNAATSMGCDDPESAPKG